MRSLLFTSSNFAIWSMVCKSGCDFCEHHLLTVQVDFPNCSANHLLVRCFSVRTTLILFRSLILSIDKKLNFDTKLINLSYIISHSMSFFIRQWSVHARRTLMYGDSSMSWSTVELHIFNLFVFGEFLEFLRYHTCRYSCKMVCWLNME